MTWPSGDPAYGGPPPPPPLPYQSYGQGPYQSYGQVPPPPMPPPPMPPKRSRKGLIIALSIVGVVVLGIVAAGIALLVVSKDRVIATELAVGDCIADIPDGDLVAAVKTVACSEPHAGEVYAALTIPGDGYPGDATIADWQNKCPDELQAYSPAAMLDETVSVFVLYPTEQTWADGDHVVTCIATTDGKSSGSLKG